MILEALINFISFIINLIFSIVPPIPNLDSSLIDSIYLLLDLIVSNSVHLLGIFVRPSTILTLIPISVIIANFEYIYKLIIWLLKKIPVINIK